MTSIARSRIISSKILEEQFEMGAGPGFGTYFEGVAPGERLRANGGVGRLLALELLS